jgi:hypothetical protein
MALTIIQYDPLAPLLCPEYLAQDLILSQAILERLLQLREGELGIALVEAVDEGEKLAEHLAVSHLRNPFA